MIAPPVDIVTGFLGSGKTTLLSHAARNGFAGERVAIVMNEIGETGLEGRAITGLEYVEQIIDLDDGCICCSIPQYRFGVAMRELVDKTSPRLVIIETTGIADPSALIPRLTDLGYPLDAVITVVDALNFERTLRAESVVREQIEAADFLVLNKCDLAQPRQLRRVEKRLRQLNAQAVLNRSVRGNVNSPLIFGTGGGFWRKEASRNGDDDREHHDHLGIQAFTWNDARRLDRSLFENVLKKLPESVYRAKGIVEFAGQDRVYSFNYVAGRVEIRPLPVEGPRGIRTIFIGRKVGNCRKEIIRMLEEGIR